LLRLESSRGGARVVFPRGRVVVAFYEPRDRLEDNLALKRALRTLASERAGLDVLAVGEVTAFDFEPVRAIVRRVVRALGASNDLEILLDWKGALTEPPFSLPRGACSVIAVDREGRVASRRTGVVTAREIPSLVDEIRALLDAPAQST
jgi:hypothetical protein